MNLSFIPTVLLWLITAVASFAQAEISASLVSMRAKVGSAVEHLGKEKFYKVIAPTDPAPVKGEAKRFLRFNQSLGLDAKRVKGDEKVDKSFEIITDGIQNIIRFQDEPYTDSLGTGFIRKVFFYFPVKVVVKNGAGEIEMELIVTEPNEEFFGIFHANMLAQATLIEGARPVVAYKEKAKMENDYETNKAAITKRLERNQTEKLFRKVERAVNSGYGENKFPSGYLYYYALDKQSVAANAELDNQCSQLKSAIAELSDKSKEENSLTKIGTCYDYFKKQLEAGISDQGVLELCLGNGAIAALISGHLPDADAWFSKFLVSYGNSRRNKVMDFADTFETLFEIYGPYYAIKQASSKEVHLNQRLRGFDDKKKNDDLIAAKKKATEDSIELSKSLPIYKDADGFIEASNGSLKGKITYDFNKPSENFKGISYPAKLKVTLSSGSSIEYTPNQVFRFTIGDKSYKSVTLHTGGVLVAAMAATGDANFVSFYEVVQEKSGVFFLEKVGGHDFAIQLKGDNKAYDVDDILRKRKIATNFLAVCPKMVEAIDNKELKPVKTRDDFNSLYQWMLKHCTK